MDPLQTITALILAFAAGFYVARHTRYARTTQAAAAVQPELPEAMIVNALAAGRRIEALRMLRAKYGYGLREAVAAADTLAAREHLKS